MKHRITTSTSKKVSLFIIVIAIMMVMSSVPWAHSSLALTDGRANVLQSEETVTQTPSPVVVEESANPASEPSPSLDTTLDPALGGSATPENTVSVSGESSSPEVTPTPVAESTSSPEVTEESPSKEATPTPAIVSESEPEIAAAINQSGYAYVLTADADANVFSSSSLSSSSLIGTLDGTGLPLCVTEYITREDASAAVRVWFADENGIQSGYIVEYKLENSVLTEAQALNAMSAKGLEPVSWSYNGTSPTLAMLPFTTVADDATDIAQESSSPPVVLYQATVVMIDDDTVDLLVLPDRDSDVVGTVANGDIVSVYSANGEWSLVLTETGEEGYLLSSLLVQTEQTPEPESTEAILPAEAPALFGAESDVGINPLADAIDPLILFNLSAAGGITEFLTGRTATLNMTLDMSSVSTSLYNVTAKIVFPTDYVENVGGEIVRAGDLSIATESVVFDSPSAGYCTVSYHFAELTGGTITLAPITIPSKIGLTPDNYELPVTATLVDENDEVLITADPVSFTFQVEERTITKLMNGSVNADNTLVYAGAADPNDSNLVASDSEVVVSFTYTANWAFYYNSDINWSNNYGGRFVSAHEIVDTLPAGAVFDASLNPGWTYDSGANTASYTLLLPDLNNVVPPTLKLKFAGADIRNTYTNRFDVTMVPLDGQPYEDTFTYSDSISFQLTTALPGIVLSKWTHRPVGDPYSPNIADSLAIKQGEFQWRINFTNPATLDLENVVITDSGLDTRLYITKVRVEGSLSTTSGGTGSFELIAVDSGGNSTTVATNVTCDGSQAEITVPANTRGFQWKTTSGSTISGGNSIDIYLTVKFVDPAGTHYTGDVSLDRMWNDAFIDANYIGSTQVFTASSIHSQPYQLVEYKPEVTLWLDGGSSGLVAGNNAGVISNVGSMWSPWQVALGDEVYLQKLVVLLPNGSEYTGGGNSDRNPNNSAGDPLYANPEAPTIIYDYKGTGQTALIYDYANPFIGTGTSSDGHGLYIALKTSAAMAEGANYVDAYLIWSNNESGSDPSAQTIYPATHFGGNTVVQDTLDIDNDGDTTELIDKSSALINIILPREVLSSKQVQGSLDSTYLLSTGTTLIGDSASYKLNVTNKSILPLSQLTALEVLPRVGDTSIVSDGSGNYTSRGSQFDVFLSGPVTAPSGFTVYYNTAAQSDSPAAYADGGGWVSSVSDYSTVRGIKIVMDSGETLDVDESVSFIVPVLADNDPTIANNAYAVNSFAISSNGVNYLESISRNLRVLKYQLSGIAFIDSNKNSLYEIGEPLLPGITVELLDSSGDPVIGPDGQPIQAVTDANGAYTLGAYETGTYRVGFIIPSGYAITDPGDDTNTSAAHIVAGEVYTGLFTISSTDDTIIRNAGLYETVGTITLSKTLQQNDGTVLTEKRDFSYIIRIDGSRLEGSADVNGSIVPITNGELAIQNSDTVTILDVPLDATYEITELASYLDDYVVSVSQNGGTASQTNIASGTVASEQSVDFVNQERAIGTLTITKVLLDERGDPDSSALSFPVVVTGPSYPTGSSFTLTNGTPLVIDNLIYGTYSVAESGAEAYTVTISGTATLTIDNQEGQITVTNAEIPVPVFTIEKSTTQTNLRAGEDVTYTIVVHNTGLGGGNDVEITEYLPSNASFKSASTSSGSYNSASNIWSAGDIPAGGSATLTLVLTVSASAKDGDTVLNTVSVTHEAGNPLADPPTDSVTTPVSVPVLSIVKNSTQSQVRAGEDITYTITVTNNGPVDASNVLITETLPTNAAFKSASPSDGTYNSISRVWSIDALDSGDTATLTLVLTTSNSAVDGSTVVNTASITSENGVTLTPAISDSETTPVRNPILMIDKNTTQTSIRPGDDITYSILVSNTGTGTASALTVSELLPANASFKSASTAFGSYNTSSNIWSIGDLAPGAQALLTLVLTSSPTVTESESVLNTVQVTEENGITLVNPPSDTVETPVLLPHLAIVKSTTQSSVRTGGSLVYTVTVTNTGLVDAKSVQVSEILPSNAVLQSATTASGNFATATNIWSIGDIAANSSAFITLTFSVVDSAVNGDTVTNTATVISENNQALTNPPASTVVTPVANPVLTIDKSTQQTLAQPNVDITYTIRVGNTGLATARSVMLAESLPANAVYKSASVSSGTYNATTHIWSIGDIAPNGSATMTLVLTVSSSAANGSTITNTATVTQENGTPLSPAPSDSVTTPVVIDGQLTITDRVLTFSGTTSTSTRTFIVRVTGPSYPNGQLFEVTTSSPLVLTGLLYGQYTVEELNASGYTVTYSGPTTISQATPSGTMAITNQEQDKSLPVTGESNVYFFVFGGLIIAIGSVALILAKRRQRDYL